MKAVQTFLGHSSPAFTLAVHVHHLEGDMPGVRFFDDLANGRDTGTAETASERAAEA